MNLIADKHKKTVADALERLVSRAENNRGITSADISPRVTSSLEKYLLRDEPDADHSAIKGYIDEIRSDDLCLIIACEKGDETAWEDLVAGFNPTVTSAARKIAANSEDADDLASSIWAELYGLKLDADGKRKSKLGYYSGRGSLGGWLRAVVSQLAIDQFRKQSKFVQVEEDRDLEILANNASENNGTTPDPEETLIGSSGSRDLSRALSSAIEDLAAEDKLILKLYYFDDLKLKDIAATFGYHEATASRRLARIQKDIRRSVEKILKAEYGWNDAEIGNFLSETAAGLGVDVEKLLAVLVLAALLQDFWR